MRDKTLVFTVTNGRSGTQYLAELLACVKGVHSVHEEKPLFSDYLSKIRDNPEAVKRFVTRKLDAIYKHVREDIYVETAHLANKGFLCEIMRQHPQNIKLIGLTRDPRKIALSMYQLNDIPARTKTGKHWYLMPGDRMSLTTLAESAETYTDYQLCYWHTQETLRRIEYFKSFDIWCVDVDLLKDIGIFEHVVRFIGANEYDVCNYGYKHLLYYNLKINRKLKTRRRQDNSRALTLLEERVLKEIIPNPNCNNNL